MPLPAPPVVVVPNWNGAEDLAPCLDSLLAQTLAPEVVVVDNGSQDGSVALVSGRYPQVALLRHAENRGFAGAMNAGLAHARARGARYAAAFNNDAVAEPDWLRLLVDHLERHPSVGAASGKVLSADGATLDSTGDYMTTWGVPHPRGRDEADVDAYDGETEIFAASGAASVYRMAMIEDVGAFDEDFFAYYEDVDLCFRAQWAGWRVAYVPGARAYHRMNTTSGRVPGFVAYHTQKNQLLLFAKNAPGPRAQGLLARFAVGHGLFFARAALRGDLGPALRGELAGLRLLPRALGKRRAIRAARRVSDGAVRAMLVPGLPPGRRVRALRARASRVAGALRTG